MSENKPLSERLEEISKRECWIDDPHSNPCEYSGGNYDDAYYGGSEDGRAGLAREIKDEIAALEKRLAEAEADTQHPESVCDDCGEKNVVWSAPSELWNAVCRPAGEVGPDPMLCPHCFIERYRAANEANTQSAIDAALESIVQEIPGGSIIDPQVVCDIIRSRIGTNPLTERDAMIAELESLLEEAYADADDVLRPRIAELERELAEVRKDAEAWKEYAQHLEYCATCGESVHYCDIGTELRNAAMRQEAE